METNFNSNRRDEYWNDYKTDDRDDLYYHLSGADKNISQDGFKISEADLLYYYYRFILEENILGRIIRCYTVKSDLALDAGCGTGRNALTLKKYFKKVKAFDVSAVFIEKNKARFKNIDFFVSNLVDLKSEEKFDLIFIGGVFMCMSDEEIKVALNKIKSLLNSDGTLVLRDTLERVQTKRASDIKIYRSEADYEKLFSDFKIIKKLNSANRNLWCSLFIRLPKVWQNLLLKLFQYLVKMTIFIDLTLIFKNKFKRHALSNQLFYILKLK